MPKYAVDSISFVYGNSSELVPLQASGTLDASFSLTTATSYTLPAYYTLSSAGFPGHSVPLPAPSEHPSARVCEYGHICRVEGRYCEVCGKSVMCACAYCGEKFPLPFQTSYRDYDYTFCTCGHLYPWEMRRLEAQEELAKEVGGEVPPIPLQGIPFEELQYPSIQEIASAFAIPPLLLGPLPELKMTTKEIRAIVERWKNGMVTDLAVAAMERECPEREEWMTDAEYDRYCHRDKHE